MRWRQLCEAQEAERRKVAPARSWRCQADQEAASARRRWRPAAAAGPEPRQSQRQCHGSTHRRRTSVSRSTRPCSITPKAVTICSLSAATSLSPPLAAEEVLAWGCGRSSEGCAAARQSRCRASGSARLRALASVSAANCCADSAFTDSISSSMRCSCVSAPERRARQRSACIATATAPRVGATASDARLLLLLHTPRVVVLGAARRDSGQPQPRAPSTGASHARMPRARTAARACGSAEPRTAACGDLGHV